MGTEKAKAKGKNVGRPVVVKSVDAELVMRLRNEGKSWRETQDVHPMVKAGKRKVKLSVGSIRRAFETVY